MGNTQSSKNAHHHSFRRKRSAVFSHISLGCASVDSSTCGSDPSQETSSLVHEKSGYRDHPSQPSETTPLSQVAYAPSEMLTNDASVAYASFLQEFPGELPYLTS